MTGHTDFCDPRRHDEDICVGPDLRPGGGWVVGVSADPECGPVVWLAHRELIPDECGGMTPANALALGEALIRQARAALAPTN